MTLVDGQPLTEDEVASREMCLCDHTRGAHRGGLNCTAPFCGCEEFAFSGSLVRRGASRVPERPDDPPPTVTDTVVMGRLVRKR